MRITNGPKVFVTAAILFALTSIFNGQVQHLAMALIFLIVAIALFAYDNRTDDPDEDEHHE